MTSHKLKTHYGGWKKPKPEVSARFGVKYADSVVVGILPSHVDLRSTLQMPPIFDQQQEGSCTANSSSRAIAIDMLRQGLPYTDRSRNYIYYNSRALENNTGEDAGASLADTVSALASDGACSEITWPYTTENMFTKPSPTAYAEGLKTKAITFKKVFNQRSPSVMKLCLSQGNPFILGFTVYESFESEQVAKTGMVPMPNLSTEQILGGHAVCCIGYDDSKKMFLCANSWGTGWGLQGYFWIPYAYLDNQNLAEDFWTIETVS